MTDDEMIAALQDKGYGIKSPVRHEEAWAVFDEDGKPHGLCSVRQDLTRLPGFRQIHLPAE